MQATTDIYKNKKQVNKTLWDLKNRGELTDEAYTNKSDVGTPENSQGLNALCSQ